MKNAASTLMTLAVGLLFATATGCSAEDSGRNEGAGLAAAGSCDGFCGGQAPSGCYCDGDCVDEGDCCSDFTAVCDPSTAHACEDEDDGGGNSNGDQVCFLGPNRSHDACVPIVAIGNASGYSYPSPLNNNYRRPVKYIDLDAVSSDTKIAPNFRLGEIAQRSKGRYAIVQPHAVEKLQEMRDKRGALRINSGYRSPGYNASISGSATRSRHMYGDAYDLKPLSSSINQLESTCTSVGGKLVEYNSHVHCDFRFTPQDTNFYGSALLADEGLQPDLGLAFEIEAEVKEDAGVFTAPAAGFDEGEPARYWSAYDAEGNLLAEAKGEQFVAPEGAATIEVSVGRVVELTHTL